jgi:hypothetical protein
MIESRVQAASACLPDPVREESARCDACGRTGTAALSLVKSQPPRVERFCRRCWPAAHGRVLKDVEAEHARWEAESLAFNVAMYHWLRACQRDPAAPKPAPPPVPPSRARAWHWTLILGSHYREWKHARRRSAESARRARRAT